MSMSNRINKNSRKSAKVTRDDQGFPIDDDFQPVDDEPVDTHLNCTTCGDLDIYCRCDPVHEAILTQTDKDVTEFCARHGIPLPDPQGYKGYAETCAILDMIENERLMNALTSYKFPTPVVTQPPVLWMALMDLAKPLAPVSAAPSAFNDRSTYAPTAADNKPFDPNEWALSL